MSAVESGAPAQELKPCPWCHGKPAFQQWGFGQFFVACTKCGAQHPRRYSGLDARAVLTEAWNTRHEEEPAKVELLRDRLAVCLADAIDTPLLELRDPECSGRTIKLTLGSFNGDIAERAATVLEEAGR